MEPRINLVTLGVADIARARLFYERGLGFPVVGPSDENVVFMKLGHLILALWDKAALADDMKLPMSPGGETRVSLAYVAHSKEAVDQVFVLARKAGATILKEPQDVFWGGYAGYFADPDGHAWEIAWNPDFQNWLKE